MNSTPPPTPPEPPADGRAVPVTFESPQADRLAGLEERLNTLERLASDLAGQIREMR